MKLAYATLAGLLLCGAAGGQAPPLEVKGVRLGSSKAELLERMPAKCYTSKCYFRPQETYDSCGPILHRDRACEQSLRERYAFGPAVVMSYEFDLSADVVARIAVNLHRNWYDRVVIALKEKYGNPTAEETRTLQNRMGATFEARVVRWDRPDGSITAHERYGSIDDARIVVTTDAFERDERAKIMRDARGAAKNL